MPSTRSQENQAVSSDRYAKILELDPTKPFENPQWEQFSRLISNGLRPADAYRQIFPGAGQWSSRSLSTEASRLRDACSKRIEVLNKQADIQRFTSKAKRMRWFHDIAHDESVPHRDRIRAMEALARICGDFVKTKAEGQKIQLLLNLAAEPGRRIQMRSPDSLPEPIEADFDVSDDDQEEDEE